MIQPFDKSVVSNKNHDVTFCFDFYESAGKIGKRETVQYIPLRVRQLEMKAPQRRLCFKKLQLWADFLEFL